MGWPIGRKHTKEEIENIKEAKKLSWIRNPNQGFTGKKRSKEDMEKFHNSESIKNRFKKGEHSSIKTEFKKGQKSIYGFKKGNIPWWILQEKEHPMKNPEIRKKAGAKGEKHPCFNNWSSREPYGKEWSKELKEKIRQRDSYRCQECFKHQSELYNKDGKKYKLIVHHIDYDKKNNNENNLISLCSNCHGQTLYGREDWKNYFKEKIGGVYA